MNVNKEQLEVLDAILKYWLPILTVLVPSVVGIANLVISYQNIRIGKNTDCLKTCLRQVILPIAKLSLKECKALNIQEIALRVKSLHCIFEEFELYVPSGYINQIQYIEKLIYQYDTAQSLWYRKSLEEVIKEKISKFIVVFSHYESDVKRQLGLPYDSFWNRIKCSFEEPIHSLIKISLIMSAIISPYFLFIYQNTATGYLSGIAYLALVMIGLSVFSIIREKARAFGGLILLIFHYRFFLLWGIVVIGEMFLCLSH